MGVLCKYLLYMHLFVQYALLYVFSSFAIILTRKRELVVLPLLYLGCLLTVNVLRLFLTVPLAGLQCVIVVFPVHSYLLFVLGDCIVLQHI